MFTYNKIFDNKKNILVVTAHPDDVMVYFGGLMHQVRKDGKNIYVVVVSNGARGSRNNEISEAELARTRLNEEKAALEYYNIPGENLFCLNYADGEVESNLKLIGEITYYIRKFKVDLICTHEPSLQYVDTYNKDGFFVQHRDHRKVGEAVIDAAYPFCRDRSFFPEQYAEGIEPHSVYDILLTDEKESNFHFDHTDTVDIKKQALLIHKTQFDENHAQEMVDAWKFGDRYIEKFNYVKILY